MPSETVQSTLQLLATLVGVVGGLLALYKHFADKREAELREWQKVVLYKIFRQNEKQPLSFTLLLEKYRLEAQAFAEVNVKKREISEDALRRILLELTASGIVRMEASDAFRLQITVEKFDPIDTLRRINDELIDIIAPNPYLYTVDEVLKLLSPRVGIAIPLLRTDFKKAIEVGNFVLNESGKVAFPR